MRSGDFGLLSLIEFSSLKQPAQQFHDFLAASIVLFRPILRHAEVGGTFAGFDLLSGEAVNFFSEPAN